MAEVVDTCYRHPDKRAGVRCQRCERLICPSCMSTASVGFHCPECTRSGKQRVYTAATLHQINRPWVTQAIIAINAAVFVAGLGEQSRNALAGRGGFILDGGLFGPAVAAGDWWRIITSGFLHAGLLHVGMNMYLLFMLGSMLEKDLGRIRFGVLYMTCLLTGSLGVLIVSPNSLTVGASGAVFGLMGALVAVYRSRRIDIMQSGLGGMLAINLVFTFALSNVISVGGHVGGLVGGLIAGWVLFEAGPKLLRNDAAATALVAALGVTAAGLCFVVA